MTIPSEIIELVERLTNELDDIERQADGGFVRARQLLERFPDNARLIALSANLGNIIFFVNSFRSRIEAVIQKISGTNASSEAMRETGEELSEIWGRVLECKIVVNRSVTILEDLQ